MLICLITCQRHIELPCGAWLARHFRSETRYAGSVPQEISEHARVYFSNSPVSETAVYNEAFFSIHDSLNKLSLFKGVGNYLRYQHLCLYWIKNYSVTGCRLKSLAGDIWPKIDGNRIFGDVGDPIRLNVISHPEGWLSAKIQGAYLKFQRGTRFQGAKKVNAVRCDPSPIGGNSGLGNLTGIHPALMYFQPLKNGNGSVGHDGEERKPVYKPLLFIVGCAFILCGLLLSKKVFWELDSYFARHDSIAVPFWLIILSAVLGIVGGILAVDGVGMLP